MPSKRDFLKATGGLVLATGGSWLATHVRGAVPNPAGLAPLPAGTVAESDLETIAGKLPLIKRTWRPPNYETPLEYFAQDFTPNNAFFVRYHLAGIPPPIAADRWTLKVGGDAASTPFEIGYDQLRRDFPAVEIAAVNQCSGNRRGLFDPHVVGVEWGIGAMGNARWKGARLKDVLAKAGLKKEAIEIAFDGADGPVMQATPDFQKSIPVWKALDENTLIAYEMNGEPLPHWNGFPARIVVPGWTGTYWMKHLTTLNALSRPFDGFWVKSAYRIPANRFPITEHFASQMTEANEPITEMVVNSLITNVSPGQQVTAGRPFEVRGIAWDGGRGIAGVEVSIDGGRAWETAALGTDHGRFSFRSFSQSFTAAERGALVVMARASNRAGATQTMELIQNPAGYHHNVVQRIAVTAV
ncbi:MAG TPA: molybdopterin-dependent oxidoreductase [Casimicrobiaceae bacterium]|nr:molybdopterin-dependent oxidoreductase [Casimicrobiaceae bacterium]